MAQSDVLKRYLDAGAAFTQLTQKRAEAIVSELVSAGEVQASQASQAVQELIDRSRASTEAIVSQVRSEMASQIKSLGLATRSDIARLEKRIDAVAKAPAEKSAANKSTANKSTAKKSAAKKSAAKKSAAKKTAAKKTAANKSTAKKTAAKKAASRR
jgi:RNA polymerase primary sigma factor